MLVKLMIFWTIKAVLGAALLMPRQLDLYGCPPLDFGSKFLLKHCWDQKSIWEMSGDEELGSQGPPRRPEHRMLPIVEDKYWNNDEQVLPIRTITGGKE